MNFWEKFKNIYNDIKKKCSNIIEYTNFNKYYIENDTNYVIKVIDENGERFWEVEESITAEDDIRVYGKPRENPGF